MAREANAASVKARAIRGAFPACVAGLGPSPMSTTFQLDTATSRANPTPQPMRRLTVPAIKGRKADGQTKEPLVMLTAYTARQAQLLDEHCDILLIGDSLGQVIYGLPS